MAKFRTLHKMTALALFFGIFTESLSLALENDIKIEGTIPRTYKSDTSLEFTIIAGDVKAPTPSSENLWNRLNVFLNNGQRLGYAQDPTGVPDGGDAFNDNYYIEPITNNYRINTDGVESGRINIIYTVEIRVTSIATNKKISDLVSDNKVSVKVDYWEPDDSGSYPSATKSDIQDTLNLLQAIPDQAVSGLTVTGSHKSLAISWNTESSIKYTDGESRNAPRVIIIVKNFGEDAGTIQYTKRYSQDAEEDADSDDPCVYTPPTEADPFTCSISCGSDPANDRYDYIDYKTLKEQEPEYENSGPAGSSGSLTISSLENGQKYGVFAFYEEGHQMSDCKVAIPERNYTMFELNSGKEATAVDRACFIATAAYGTPFHKHLDLFRWFRDQYLITNRFGKAFVDWYYENSPPAAEWIEVHPWAQALTRTLLWPVAKGLELLKNEEPARSQNLEAPLD